MRLGGYHLADVRTVYELAALGFDLAESHEGGSGFHVELWAGEPIWLIPTAAA